MKLVNPVEARAWVLFRLMHLGMDQENEKHQSRKYRKENEAGSDLCLMKVNLLPLETAVELSQFSAAENLSLLCSDQL